ncbi:hypothetical protein D5086_002807 [Populus alba]|uniref:Uncharacterized protein n=1 Tax=Populus alba TaxID=43335 RepID=A0ACC4D4E5_POPAL
MGQVIVGFDIEWKTTFTKCSWRRRQGSMAFRCSALCTVKCSSRIFNYVSNTNDPDLSLTLSYLNCVLPGKAAVMQICGNTSLCHVMHTFHSGITSLQFLLEDSTLVKVGVGISGDCAKVLRDYNVSVKSVRTFPIMQIKSLVENLKLGVFALAKILVCKEEGCENGNLGYAEALHKDQAADVSLRWFLAFRSVSVTGIQREWSIP